MKQILGHKSLDNTMKYTQLIGSRDDEFSARVAHDEDEVCQLIGTVMILSATTTVTKSLEYETTIKIGPGIAAKHGRVDWGGFEPPTS